MFSLTQIFKYFADGTVVINLYLSHFLLPTIVGENWSPRLGVCRHTLSRIYFNISGLGNHCLLLYSNGNAFLMTRSSPHSLVRVAIVSLIDHIWIPISQHPCLFFIIELISLSLSPGAAIQYCVLPLLSLDSNLFISAIKVYVLNLICFTSSEISLFILFSFRALSLNCCLLISSFY